MANKKSSNTKSNLISITTGTTLLAMPAFAGIGMTVPDTPPGESCTLNVSGGSTAYSMTPLLPLDGYNLGQNSGTINPLNNADVVSTTCNTSWTGCPSVGSINEQDGRLNNYLRGYAASQDSKYILASAVWTQLGLTVPGNLNPSNQICGGFVSPGGASANCATAMAQLAVTGRHAFNSFANWSSPASSTSGPQLGRLNDLVQSGYTAGLPGSAQLAAAGFTVTIPPIPDSVKPVDLALAENTVLQQAYTALWAIRSNDPTWRQYRQGAGWMAVSGEDDTPHRPVNVTTAPFQQFDIPVPVTVNGQPFTLTTRYSLMSKFTGLGQLSLCSSGCPAASPASIPAPPIPTVLTSCGPPGKIEFCNFLEMPPQTPVLKTGQAAPEIFLYIHGGGSRLEEADTLATQLILRGSTEKVSPVVVSFDLPDSAYSDTELIPVGGPGSGTPVPVDASSAVFENGVSGSAPANIGSFPVLNFEINFINGFVMALQQNNIIDTSKIVAVMGGSLGGNTSLILQMHPLPSPFSLTSPLSIPPSAAMISWSPTSMVQQQGSLDGVPVDQVIIDGNTCCLPWYLGGKGKAGPTWETEAGSTRSQYFGAFYFSPTTALGGLPPDPEMWYRNDWADANGVNDCKASYITQSRFDKYEIYSSLARLWNTALDTEQAIFSFQTNTDATGKTWSPFYGLISGRILLAAGACDDYDNEITGLLYTGILPTGFFSGLQSPLPFASTGAGVCNNQQIGNTGANVVTHEDIYGFTHDVANDLQMATGKTLFINDTGHSIHDERPAYFAQQIINFLSTPDNNIEITLTTGNDDARENSEVHAFLASSSNPANPFSSILWSLDVPLNYWFHPWPSGPANGPLLAPGGSPDNPCGVDCTKINAFDLRNHSTHNFTIALPEAASSAPLNMFALEFFSGWNQFPPGSIFYGNDNWDLQAISACVPGATSSFVNDSYGGSGYFIQAKNYGPPAVFYAPPSFSSSLGTTNVIPPNTCQHALSNFPPNSQAPGL